jgi:uncharacterized RDD family membrane protein YckC
MTRDDDVIITGEAVALEVRQASFLSRVLAISLDLLIYAVVVFAGLAVIGSLTTLDEAAVGASLTVLAALVMVVIPATVETLTRGRSVGKLAAGLSIVRDDGGPVRFRHALVRALVGIGELWLTTGLIAIVCSILHPKGKRVGDIAAGTYCVRVRGGERVMPPLSMPPELATWAATADIRALPDGLALHARRFLARTGSLNSRSRETIGLALAARVEPLVAPPPPWGTDPEPFLAAVLVARRERELALGWAARKRHESEVEGLRRLPFGIPDPG